MDLLYSKLYDILPSATFLTTFTTDNSLTVGMFCAASNVVNHVVRADPSDSDKMPALGIGVNKSLGGCVFFPLKCSPIKNNYLNNL